MSRNKRNLKPQTPGQPPAPVQADPAPEVVTDAAEQLTGDQTEAAEQVDPVIDPAPEPTPDPAPEVVQPVQARAKIDPKKLKQPVMTENGWLCPEV